MYIVARLLLGFGIPTCIVSGAALIGELSYPKERAFLTSYFNVAFYLGQILAAGICFGTNSIPNDWAWRIPSWLQMAPSLMQMGFVFFLPESPRHLITKGRHDEAYAILAKYHTEGDRGHEFVEAEFSHMRTTIELEYETAKMSYMDLVRTSGMRRRTIISAGLGLFTQWSGNTLISYYLSDILNMIGLTDSVLKQQINLGISCWSLVCGVVIVQVCVRLKRVTAAYICTVSLLVVYVSWTIAMQQSVVAMDAGGANQAANIAVLVFIFLYKPAYQIFYNALTYSTWQCFVSLSDADLLSLPRRDLALRRALPRHRHPPALRPLRRLHVHVHQPCRPRRRGLEVLHHVLRHTGLRDPLRLSLLPRNGWANP